MAKLEGIKANESVFHTIRCTYEELWGDLVLTNKGIIYLQIQGMLGQGRERLHHFEFDEIRRIQTKTKKAGIFRNGIVIDHQPKSLENQSYFYSCEEYKAVLFLAFFERQKLLLMTPEKVSSTIQSLSTLKRNADLLKVSKDPKLRPYFFAFALDKIETELLNLLKYRSDVDISEVAMSKQIHSLIALLYESDPRKIPKEQIYYTVTDLVSHLILHDKLDGIITDVGRYVSNRALSRITVPLDMLADFETIYSQLYEKGLIIWEVECTNCFRRMKYPKKGKKIACEFCKEDIHAIDVFKKYVDLL